MTTQIQTPQTLRQLCYLQKIAESLSTILSDADDDKFNPVAFELANAIERRIGCTIDLLNAENVRLNRERVNREREELTH